MLKINYNLIFTVINLLVLFVALRVVFFKPVKKILEERQALVNQSIADAEQAKAQAQEMERAWEEERSRLEAGREQLVSSARQKASEEYDRIVSGAQQEAEEIVRAAALDAQKEREELLQKARGDLSELVLSAAAGVMASARQEGGGALYDQFLQKAGELTDDAEA